jgi:cation diffusion facilitator family transporter
MVENSHHPPDHGHELHHRHTHGVVDPSIIAANKGIWAIKWSFVGLMATALTQLVIVWLSSSIALFADTIHNFADAMTSLPLWIAFTLARWKPGKQFPYGYGRVENLAGLTIVLTMLLSAIVAGYESIRRLLHPQSVNYLWAVVLASLIGFIGNEAVAVFRIKVGKQMESAALVADGYHARVDGLTSLSVLFGTIGVWLGYPLADPIVGILITLAVLAMVWQSVKTVFTQLLDGIDPKIIDEMGDTAGRIKSVRKVTDVRARWIGHRLHAELNIAVAPRLHLSDAHDVAKEVRHQLLHHFSYLSSVLVHVDPEREAGEEFHSIGPHRHDGLPLHSH